MCRAFKVGQFGIFNVFACLRHTKFQLIVFEDALMHEAQPDCVDCR